MNDSLLNTRMVKLARLGRNALVFSMFAVSIVLPFVL